MRDRNMGTGGNYSNRPPKFDDRTYSGGMSPETFGSYENNFYQCARKFLEETKKAKIAKKVHVIDVGGKLEELRASLPLFRSIIVKFKHIYTSELSKGVEKDKLTYSEKLKKLQRASNEIEGAAKELNLDTIFLQFT